MKVKMLKTFGNFYKNQQYDVVSFDSEVFYEGRRLMSVKITQLIGKRSAVKLVPLEMVELVSEATPKETGDL